MPLQKKSWLIPSSSSPKLFEAPRSFGVGARSIDTRIWVLDRVDCAREGVGSKDGSEDKGNSDNQQLWAVLARVSSIEIAITRRIYEDLWKHILLRNEPPHGNSILGSNSVSWRPDNLGLCKISWTLIYFRAESSLRWLIALGSMWFPWKPSTGVLGTADCLIFVDLFRQGGVFPS